MIRRLAAGLLFSLVGASTFMMGGLMRSPTRLSAETPTACSALLGDPAAGIVGNPDVVSSTATFLTQLTSPTGAVLRAAHCQVDIVISERGGPENGYAVGERQRIAIRIGLPANSLDGGTGGGASGEGAWNGKVRNLGGGGMVGAVGSVLTPVNARYVGSSTDTGHTGSVLDGSWGVIQSARQLNVGKVDDYYDESLRLQYQWALRLTSVYFGKPAARNYWDSCSTGGRQGLVLANQHGEDFDGFLIGAPYTAQSRTASALMHRFWANIATTGASVTPAKLVAALQRINAECDAADGVVDGIVSQPGRCKASARLNLCGAPGAPTTNCLTETEAAVIDAAVDGPRNDKGHRIWAGLGRGVANMVITPSTTSGVGLQHIFAWGNQDLTFDYRGLPLSDYDDTHQLVTNVVGPHLDMQSPNLDRVRNRNAKILMYHGMSDDTMPWPQNAYYYNKVLEEYGGEEEVIDWFRLFLVPGMGHCGGGPFAAVTSTLFDTMVAWAEGGSAPDQLLGAGTVPGPTPVPRTRPICRFPRVAIYDNTGDVNSASSWSCGGNVNTAEDKCDLLVVKYQEETGTKYESLGGVTALSCGFVKAPVSTAALSPAPQSGWYIEPTVTLSATDADGDLDRIEYRLDGDTTWRIYASPFTVSGDGLRTLEYRAVDKGDNVEAVRTRTFGVDATAPVLTGLPVLPCSLWPPNGKTVQVASIVAQDVTSGVPSGALMVTATSDEAVEPGDIVVDGGTVTLRAARTGSGQGRTYSINVSVSDLAGNRATESVACAVPHDAR